MRTPYCSAIGLQRREVDQIRISIGVEIGRLTEVERRQAELEHDVNRERSIAADGFDLPATAYFARMHAEKSQLEESQREIDAKVTWLRTQAREVYGSLNAIEGAATRYRDAETRRIEGAEQSAIDDRSAVDFLTRLRSARVAAGRRR
ncbi:hypothetical protein [Novosphingobium sp. M1R2S20]|uniref:Flagellar FliJ protein n=1 Tax=Novosphingobium rhizovicinum TaxID=3228928 RepID=A0ABV3RB08_9SPHN